mmetsp:Transcript_51305/g.164032  ORF Transcript_51305/g.164032 Transcript_51305/m.164032 type:complete len:126 (+) Transcript_51305:125-502(+)|eukprot:CAMPEP_0182866300 /NCGR_PEP_ID=MMETSP0034_2-20130328/8134_1 /TAXON_ID=156128 /ORGANISM="Nephroselmis pyriformis, Strain CCMP717" /LENGTH=125 /DNA_ID=CAMNT_0024998627 /DNA_START=176 /DNA_END=553 /DNA_ORIENTATION=+
MADPIASYNIRFRMNDGTDLGPWHFPSAGTVGQMKEKVVAEFPAAPGGEGGAAVPKTVNDVTLILAGKVMDNAKIISDLRTQMGNPGSETLVTFHLVVRPHAAAKTQTRKEAEENKPTKCGCVIC